MIRTTLMTDRDEYGKGFSHLDIFQKSSKRLTAKNRFFMVRDLTSKTRNLHDFNPASDKVHLYETNEIYHLVHILSRPSNKRADNVDIVLPKVKNITDWVVLFYDQDQSIYSVFDDNFSKIKLYGNGSRIMGYDEPLICDVPFMSLRLTYVNDVDGWIIT